MKINMAIISISSIYFLLLNVGFIIADEKKEQEINRWDIKIIQEAAIWKGLLINYANADKKLHWPETKKSLEFIVKEYPNSRWIDDALILLAGGQASVEQNIEQAISTLRNVIQDYSNESTIITCWDASLGCRISNTWLMWAPSLAFLNDDKSIRTSFPFDKDGCIDILEKEALTYFEHLGRHPNLTKDVAHYIIASMFYHSGYLSEALSEIEYILTDNSILQEISAIDYFASIKSDGHLIYCEPPTYSNPIWRVQYAMCKLAVNIYLAQGNQNKAFEMLSKLGSICNSDDGWHWNINQFIADTYFTNNQLNLAAQHYDKALKSIHQYITGLWQILKLRQNWNFNWGFPFMAISKISSTSLSWLMN